MRHWHNHAMPSPAKASATTTRKAGAAGTRPEEPAHEAGPPAADDMPPPLRPMPAAPLRWTLQLFAWLSLATGIAGIFIPGLPTTVFILMAAWAAARSSQRMHHWLWRHRLFGPMLRNWARGGCVSRRAKWSATAMMGLCAGMLLYSRPPAWAQTVALICMGSVLAWLWLRPEP